MRKYILTAILVCSASLGTKAQTEGERLAIDKAMYELRKDMPDKTVAMNPVTDFDCPDPSIVKIDEWFYCFKTGYPIKIYRSHDLCNWTYYRDMFPGPNAHDPFGDGKPDPMHTGAGKQNINYWAPSPALIKGKLVVYLTLFAQRLFK